MDYGSARVDYGNPSVDYGSENSGYPKILLKACERSVVVRWANILCLKMENCKRLQLFNGLKCNSLR